MSEISELTQKLQPAQQIKTKLIVNEMIVQVDSVVKKLISQNAALRKENADLKAQQATTI